MKSGTANRTPLMVEWKSHIKIEVRNEFNLELLAKTKY